MKAANASTITSVRLSADDRLDIFDLFARYAWAYDCSDADTYAECFAPDGVLADAGQCTRAGPGCDSQGHPPFLRHARDEPLAASQRSPAHRRRRAGVHGGSDWAVLEHRKLDDYHGVGRLGYYFSHCVKLDGRWYFRERTFYDDLHEGLPWKTHPRARTEALPDRT